MTQPIPLNPPALRDFEPCQFCANEPACIEARSCAMEARYPEHFGVAQAQPIRARDEDADR